MVRFGVFSLGLVSVVALSGCSLVRGVPATLAAAPGPAATASAPNPQKANPQTADPPETEDPPEADAPRMAPDVSGTYEVLGKTYPVWSDAAGYVERGFASWYGEELAGQPTASGEPFDPYGMTAAHRSLPLGARVEVENLENGRTVIVRVNDRGPFVDDRIIDLSLASAQALGFAAHGTARVEVRSVD